jgi:hypothetical protein
LLTEKIIEILQELGEPGASHIAQVRPLLTNTMLRSLVQQSKSKLVEDLYLVNSTDDSVNAELFALVEPCFLWVWTMHQQGLQQVLANTSAAGPQRTMHGGEGGGGGGGAAAVGAVGAVGATRYHYQQPQHQSHEDVGPGSNYYLSQVTGQEETIWSAALGMKGQIDMVGRARLFDAAAAAASVYAVRGAVGAAQGVSSLLQAQELALPIELKTGKWRASTVISHRAQVILYVLMMTVREQNGAVLTTKVSWMCLPRCVWHEAVY